MAISCQGRSAGCDAEQAGWIGERSEGVVTVARTVSAKQAALRTAREKRLALDTDRDARDRRVEEVTAEVLLLLQERVDAEAAVVRINQRIGAELQQFLDDGVGMRGAAQLTGLGVAEIRSLMKAVAGGDEP